MSITTRRLRGQIWIFRIQATGNMSTIKSGTFGSHVSSFVDILTFSLPFCCRAFAYSNIGTGGKFEVDWGSKTFTPIEDSSSESEEGEDSHVCGQSSSDSNGLII